MRRTLPPRRMPRHHLLFPKSPRRRTQGHAEPPMRTSDFVLALLGVVLLGGLALTAAYALASGA